VSLDNVDCHRILDECWTTLQAAAATPDHPFRTGVFATRSGPGVTARTVVIRAVSRKERRIAFNTERRTMKVSELEADDSCAWLFYDAQKMVQLRLGGRAEVATDRARTDPFWNTLPLPSYRNFLTRRPPGTPLEHGSPDLAPHLLSADSSLFPDDVQEARANFAVVFTTIEAVDWVQLDPSGAARDARARFAWQAPSRNEEEDGDQGHWKGNWVVP